MHNVHVNHKINSNPKKIWEVLDKFGGISAYHPLVKTSPIANGVESGLGAERVCHFEDGNSIKERIVEYDAGKSYKVSIIDAGAFPLNEAIATLSVKPISNNESNVSFDMNFKPKFGPMGWLMAKLMMEGQFKKTLSSVLQGLEDHIRTGKVVGKNGVLLEQVN
jgi:hypothetical protein